jgi:hypothetical protein
MASFAFLSRFVFGHSSTISFSAMQGDVSLNRSRFGIRRLCRRSLGAPRREVVFRPKDLHELWVRTSSDSDTCVREFELAAIFTQQLTILWAESF